MTEIEKIVDRLSKLTVIEASDLASALEKKWNISSSISQNNQPVIKEEKAQKKTKFNVVLKSVGQQKIKVIRLIKEITSLGLKESRDKIDSIPFIIKSNINEDIAKDIKKKFALVGAEIEIK